MIPGERHFNDKGVFTRAGHPAGAFDAETMVARQVDPDLLKKMGAAVESGAG